MNKGRVHPYSEYSGVGYDDGVSALAGAEETRQQKNGKTRLSRT
jgi:hypothetical protein